MSLPANKAFRLRFLIQAVGANGAISYQLEHKVNSGAYGATGTSTGVAIRITPSSYINPSAADTTTQQLTGATGSFTSGRISDDTNPLPSITVGSDGNTEIEWCIYPDITYINSGDIFSFRVTKAGVALDTYSQNPSIMFSIIAPIAWIKA